MPAPISEERQKEIKEREILFKKFPKVFCEFFKHNDKEKKAFQVEDKTRFSPFLKGKMLLLSF